MAFNISSNGIISVTRGDTFTAPISVDMGTPIQPLLYLLESHYTFIDMTNFPNLDIRDNYSLYTKGFGPDEENPGYVKGLGYKVLDYFDEYGKRRKDEEGKDIPLPDDFYDEDLTSNNIHNEEDLEKYYDGDKLYFGLMEPNTPFENALVKKTFKAKDMNVDTRTIDLDFDCEDTEYLLPGNYYYSVKLYRAPTSSWSNNKAHTETIISKTKFVIMD